MISSKVLATAALSAAVIGSIGLAYAQTTVQAPDTTQNTGTPQPGTPGTMTTPGTMGTANSGTMSTNPNATGVEPMPRADRN